MTSTEIERKHTIADGLELAAQVSFERAGDMLKTREVRDMWQRRARAYSEEAKKVRAE